MPKKDPFFELEAGAVILEGTPGKWDANGVHTLSIVEANLDGWRYWGYYCGGKAWYSLGAGLARSNDLQHWEKFSLDEPLVSTDAAGYGARWPCVVRENGLFYMLTTKDYITDSHIVLYTSRDGIHFDFVKEIVRAESGLRNQNPNLLYEKNKKKWRLYYYHGNDKNLYQIRARVSREIIDLDTGQESIVLENRMNKVLASPSMMIWKRRYFLLTETAIQDPHDWRTRAWSSRNPLKGFTELKNSPLPEGIHACAFQHILDGRLVITYSYQKVAQPEWEWDVRMTQIDLNKQDQGDRP
jgi:hypothetical protein